MTGQTVTHYRLVAKIGEGAGAVVYHAHDLSLGREVVLKFVASGELDGLARFQHEARTISSLNHPNICTIYEIGEHEGWHFLAMEMLEGDVLAKLIGRGPLGTARVIDVGTQIADALDAAHAERIVHRDLKPANVFVTRGGHVKLLDFGVALLLPRKPHAYSSGRLTTSTAGTIPYMSPEQAQAEELDHRSDLFSLGVVLYEMATGHRPFVAATGPDTLAAITTCTPVAPRVINARIPDELERIIVKALEKKAALRYQTASDLKADLQRLKKRSRGKSGPGASVAAAANLARAGSAMVGGWSGCCPRAGRRRVAVRDRQDAIVHRPSRRAGAPAADSTGTVAGSGTGADGRSAEAGARNASRRRPERTDADAFAPGRRRARRCQTAV